jgi:methionyl-tRNA formyltransferase
MEYLICAYRPWNLAYFKEVHSDPLTLEKVVSEKNPEWIFFLDWSWKVPQNIIDTHKCVCFHEADLPDFRGGSPIQNQIVRGIKKTKLTAFMMDGGIDTGDILLQEELDLSGHLWEIMDRVVHLTDKMIDRILSGGFTPRKQGEGTCYKRRTPQDSKMDINLPLEKLYDFIRMLEEPYPNAFIHIGNKKMTFKWAQLRDKLEAYVEIE